MAEPKFGPIGKEVYERTYRRVKSDGEFEVWEDTVRRVIAGNTGLVDEKFIEDKEREKLFDLIFNFKAIPAGRHLWVSGVPGRQFLLNCFHGSEEVITRSGVFQIRDLEGVAEVLVPGIPGASFKEVEVKYFGEQEIYELEVSRHNSSKTIKTTAGHNWYVGGDSVTTDELKVGDVLDKTTMRSMAGIAGISITGIKAGLVYGDGTKTAQDSRIRLCSDSKQFLDYFQGEKIDYYLSEGGRMHLICQRELLISRGGWRAT
jgi:Ribonucleotide reductase alpha domain